MFFKDIKIEKTQKGAYSTQIGSFKGDMQSNIGEALFTKTQQRVLGLLYGQTDRSFYLNELINLAGMGRGTIRRELDKLSDVGLITAKKQGNQIHYQANGHHPVFKELKSIVKKTFGVVGTIQSALADILPEVTYAFVYGSVAKGSEGAESDVDLMIVADGLSYTYVMEALATAEEQIGRTINPTIYNEHEFKKRLSSNQSFLTRVMSQEVLWIKGFEQFSQEYGG